MKSIFKCELYNKLSAEVNLSVVIVALASGHKGQIIDIYRWETIDRIWSIIKDVRPALV